MNYSGIQIISIKVRLLEFYHISDFLNCVFKKIHLYCANNDHYSCSTPLAYQIKPNIYLLVFWLSLDGILHSVFLVLLLLPICDFFLRYCWLVCTMQNLYL